MREPGVGSAPRRCGFPAEVHGVRASDHGVEKARRKEYETDYKKGETG